MLALFIIPASVGGRMTSPSAGIAEQSGIGPTLDDGTAEVAGSDDDAGASLGAGSGAGPGGLADGGAPEVWGEDGVHPPGLAASHAASNNERPTGGHPLLCRACPVGCAGG